MKKYIIYIVLGLLLAGGAAGIALTQKSEPGQYDQFAMCLEEKGAIFYGAFWCTHCQAQKKLFGKSAKLLPYVECSTLDGKNQMQICKDEKIEGYPTWVFEDGERMSGEISLEKLAEKTGCALPEISN